MQELLEKKSRLTTKEAIYLLENASLTELGMAADLKRQTRHDRVTFVVDRNINYSNVCSTRCDFCAFYTDYGKEDGYVLDTEEVLIKVAELVAIGGTQVLMQGGNHPKLPFEYYLNLLRAIKKEFPEVDIHSFSPPEIIYFSKLYRLPVEEILKELMAAGLASLPGGGAEILVDRVRQKISPYKATTAEWLEVMRIAGKMGMKASATMMFGHVETLEERVLHLERLRELQDEVPVFTAFIAWSFQPANTALAHLQPATAYDYLRVIALARLYLDNIPNIQTSWVTQGPKVGQIALAFGCNDMGGTMMEENVVRKAGTSFSMTQEEIIRAIKVAGFRPAQRRTNYQIIKEF